MEIFSSCQELVKDINPAKEGQEPWRGSGQKKEDASPREGLWLLDSPVNDSLAFSQGGKRLAGC
jgi:hypothetical protein